MRHSRFSITLLTLFSLFVSASLQTATLAQVRPVNDYGANGIVQLLKRLNTTASVMMIGAHPDDEDSALLAYLARGENARTAYLSLTRGDGGQNIIGPELFESLGVIRTEELLQARRLDGAEQYFTRAYDYGFSKTLAEARQKWDEKVITCDAVKAIRLFRPMVVISRFTGTPADGHGQHQYAGYISPLAVGAAADPGQCTDAGPAWQVLKFYVEQSFSDTKQPSLRINTGQYEPVLGRTYFEISMEGRSQHRSQGEGRLELRGDQFSGVNLAESHTQRSEKETSIFDGINTTIAAIDDPLGISERPTYADLTGASELAANLLKDYRPAATTETATGLVQLYKLLQSAAHSSSRTPAALFVLNKKLEECAAGLGIASGVQIDALADKETVVPGDDLAVSVKAYLHSSAGSSVADVRLGLPMGWNASKADAPTENTAGFFRREAVDTAAYYQVAIPKDARVDQPYWLQEPRDGDLYHWPAEDYTALPFQPHRMSAVVTINFSGTDVLFERPLQFRFADPSRGEIRRNVDVVPRLSVALDQPLLIISDTNTSQVRRVVMSITNNGSAPVSGTTSLNFNSPVEWKYTSSSSTFSLKNKGDRASIAFDVTIPPNSTEGIYEVYGHAMVAGSLATTEMRTIAYPHIQTHRFYTRAETRAEVFDLKTAPSNVGYIMGSGDEVPDAIKRMGLNVTMLEENDLASGDLSKFDTIVVGIRASETRPDLLANNARIMEYVRAGGNLIVQYQRANFARSGLPPFPLDTQDKQGTAAGSVARVVDETAPVKILEPEHAVFNFPNKITTADFSGWVQERNAYNLVTFDPNYKPLLESHDVGEQENKGGLVVAPEGEGTWVYCSYSFFRQLPAGVPGAYRLFANLLALPRSKK